MRGLLSGRLALLASSPYVHTSTASYLHSPPSSTMALYVEPVGTEQSGTQTPSCIISPGSHPTGGAAVDVVDDVSSADAPVGAAVGVGTACKAQVSHRSR